MWMPFALVSAANYTLSRHHFAKSRLRAGESEPTQVESILSSMPYSNLVVVQAFATQIDADIAKSVLESAGIDAMIQADRAGGMRDHLAWSGFGFKVLVRDEDAAAAGEVLHPPHKVPEGKLVVAQWCGTQAEADVAQGALESAGIAAAIEAVPVGDTNSPLSVMEPLFRVLVTENDATGARDVLNPSDETPA
jgi:hypothetical protein